MRLRDILDKGVDLLNKGAESVSNVAESVTKTIEDKKNAVDKFNYLTSISNHLEGTAPYIEKNSHPSASREQSILELGLTINVENSKLINKLIPVDETILNIKSTMEAKTKIEYMFVITDKRLWILNRNEYKKYNFEEITKCELVNKSVLTQNINFNNMAFIFDGSEQSINTFIELLTNIEFRTDRVKESTKYLCGITPKLQLTTENYTGITIGINNEVVIHENKDISYLLNINDLEYMQLLLDNSVIMTKGISNQTQTSSIVPARKMSIKFILKDKSYTIDIMKENLMGTIVKVEDSSFQNAYELSKNIMTTIENFMNQQKIN